MNEGKKIVDFYINSNIHVSLSVMAMTLITGAYYDLNVNGASVFLGFSTFVSYNGIRFMKFKGNLLKNEISNWFKSNLRILLVLNFIALIVVIYYVFTFWLILAIRRFVAETSAVMTNFRFWRYFVLNLIRVILMWQKVSERRQGRLICADYAFDVFVNALRAERTETCNVV